MRYFISMLVAVIFSLSVSCGAVAEQCKVLKIEKKGEGVYNLTLDPSPLMDEGFTGEWYFIEGPDQFSGKNWPVDLAGNVLIATLSGKNPGDQVEFYFGRGDYGAVPGCAEEALNYHFIITIPEDVVVSEGSPVLAPINSLLLNGKP